MEPEHKLANLIDIEMTKNKCVHFILKHLAHARWYTPLPLIWLISLEGMYTESQKKLSRLFSLIKLHIGSQNTLGMNGNHPNMSPNASSNLKMTIYAPPNLYSADYKI